MTQTEFLKRMHDLERRYDGAVPRHALKAARYRSRLEYEQQLARSQSGFYDRLAREAQRAIQCHRKASHPIGRRREIHRLAAALASARRHGLASLDDAKKTAKAGRQCV